MQLPHLERQIPFGIKEGSLTAADGMREKILTSLGEAKSIQTNLERVLWSVCGNKASIYSGGMNEYKRVIKRIADLALTAVFALGAIPAQAADTDVCWRTTELAT